MGRRAPESRGDGGDFFGNVHRLEGATGAEIWHVELPAQSWDGEWTVDASSDGVPDIVTACQDGSVSMLDAADGREIWRAPLSEEDGGFRLTTVGGPEPWIGVGTYAYNNGQRNGIYALDAFDGSRLGRTGAEYHVFDVTAGDVDGNGDEELIAAAGWQIHVLDAR